MTGDAEQRRFSLALVLAVAVAAVARGWGFGALGIDHFDEGVYVFTAWAWVDAAQPLGAYPDQILFSPPVYPALVALAYLLLGVAAEQAILVNIVVGTATVALVGRVGARWFGKAAGAAAAWMMALDPLHVALSRSALTDVTFLFLFIGAVALLVRSAEEGSWRWGVAAGIAVGLAWNTKYHGWFALLVGSAAFVPGLWNDRRRGPAAWVRRVAPWGVAAAVAALCYLPWALHVHGTIGYPALMAYQGTNIDGTWLGNLAIQVAQQSFLETPFSRLAPVLALVAAWGVQGRGRVGAGRVGILTGVAVVGAVAGAGAAAVVLTALALARGVRLPGDRQAWALLAWVALWVVSAPIYHPYARLLAPFWAVTALGAGWGLTTLGRGLARGRTDVALLPAAALAGAAVVATAWVGCSGAGPWRPSDGVRRVADEMTGHIPEGQRVVVVGEPELAFYLHLRGRPAFERTESPDAVAAVDESVYLVTGRYVEVADVLRDGILVALDERLTPVARFGFLPKDIRILDDRSAQRGRELIRSGGDDFDLRLFRLRGAEAP